MHLHTRGHFQYACTDLDQMKTNGVKLRFRKSRFFQAVHTKRMQNLICQAVQEESELIGLKTGTRRTVALQMYFVFLDPKLHLAALAVNVFVQVFGAWALQVCHNKTGVGSFFIMFRLYNHPSGLLPTLGTVRKFAVAL